MSEQSPSFKPSLSLFDATMLVAGSMIGSGIFIVSADMLRQVGSSGMLILVWAVTAVMTLAAAISYGELSGMFPKAGGQYVYLSESWGRLTGFLYGWTLFTVIQTGTIAAVGVAFAKFAGYFWPVLDMKPENILLQVGPLSIYPAQLLSILIILLLTWFNTQGVNAGKILQSVFTTAKILALLGLFIFGLSMGFNAEVWKANWAQPWTPMPGLQTDTTIPFLGLFAAAMVGSVFSADAWNNITFIAGEVRNPKRNIGLALLLGTGTVLALYLLTNLMYTGALSLPEIASSPQDRVGVAVAERILGSAGTQAMAILIMVSTFGCINGMILSGSRVYYTMANDGLFFRATGKLNANQVPARALWVQGLWASVLCLSGRYGDLLDYVVFAVLIFYILTIAGIFKLRRTRPDTERPYRAFGYPLLPALYMVLALVMGICLLIWKPQFTLPGLGLVLLGIPVYFLAIRGRQDFPKRP
jgi:APA family basic amino acid/polyamine antiporter